VTRRLGRLKTQAHNGEKAGEDVFLPREEEASVSLCEALADPHLLLPGLATVSVLSLVWAQEGPDCLHAVLAAWQAVCPHHLVFSDVGTDSNWQDRFDFAQALRDWVLDLGIPPAPQL
jgi:hypothetical protein